MMPRPSAACRRALLVILLTAALPAVLRADDVRLAPLKDLDGAFPFTPPSKQPLPDLLNYLSTGQPSVNPNATSNSFLFSHSPARTL